MDVRPEHEGYVAPGTEELWQESHRLDAVFPAARAAVSLLIGRHPSEQRASFVATYLREGQRPTVIVEQDVPLPRERWEIRASGLWADHVCETPLEHWSYGLEAFALMIDDPSEMLGKGVGDRVPLGWELEFEAGQPAGWMGPNCYQQMGETHGLVLTDEGELAVQGSSIRTHYWGLGGPVELHVGRNHRPVHSRVRLPGDHGIWQLDAGVDGFRIRTT